MPEHLKESECACDDTISIDDPMFDEDVLEWQACYNNLKEAIELEKDARAVLINSAGNRSVMNRSVKMECAVRKGAVDYKRIPQLKGVDLTLYRKPSTSYFKITQKEVNDAGASD